MVIETDFVHVGLMMTILTGGELFTGNTALVTLALLEKKANIVDLLRIWFWSYIGNFAGCLLIARMALSAGTLGDAPAVVAAAVAKCALPFKTLFVRGVLCNWLVCMAIFMTTGSSSLPGKMTAILFTISAFVAIGLEHSVANMFIIPFGIMNGAKVSFVDFLVKNLLPVTLGNIVGGTVFVALAYSAVYGSLLTPKSEDGKESKKYAW